MSDSKGSHRALTLEQLAVEYGHWEKLPGIDSDSYGAFEQLATIYRYAISNYNEPGVEKLIEALAEAGGQE
ncbi:hypothetical protein HQ346_12850 [Rhodococcus sp. BP-252]|uniref:hypothetical protein n=1 Tax=unclassified Rhodococcus (in: high G+C Gram-positive bacteria) TaxID=192944 RepID=UPI001C9A4D4B|nr:MULTISPECIES: hypothetical protein [unclassified Rhodococcus (in: high G+C Gram-positive bacteria)]MBY6411705.1 hypothetical protein [Rhodococcus sp. BP-320]MBY6417310.1 hypothetical protein [Rhodococcus sp. BP-321]MBY6421905.1 hypothetical protein [Rhodococcus sp. BP-324]MBY6427334.1 hypothetical protein [Rhodococcus sp. BP-323]MBY6432523.1 hypothetical protein [Rhodococcus sp. BP-322]